ncbi:MAG: cytochrome bd-I oxidase subunit CydX [Gammaproteobacteria bacterium]|nr:cytochrome bd-I oxidase subunit CydX [Gammaproteobacteria bacterium]
MWYFTWVLGVLLAASFAITNALWLEVSENMDRLNMEYDQNESP